MQTKEDSRSHELSLRVLVATKALMPLSPGYGVEILGSWIRITRIYQGLIYTHQFSWEVLGTMAKPWLEMRIKKEIEKITADPPRIS